MTIKRKVQDRLKENYPVLFVSIKLFIKKVNGIKISEKRQRTVIL